MTYCENHAMLNGLIMLNQGKMNTKYSFKAKFLLKYDIIF